MINKRRSHDSDALAYSNIPGSLFEAKMEDGVSEALPKGNEEPSKENFGETAIRRERAERYQRRVIEEGESH